MPIASLQQRLDGYKKLMEELKHRHESVRDLFKGKHGLTKLMVRDLCYLQLRFMCELVALGCLVVHGDVPATRSKQLRKAYRADFIVTALEKLHPDFYPHPVIRKAVPGSVSGKFNLVPETREHLTKSDLLKLYAECGANLHRGTIEDLHSPRINSFDSAALSGWATKFARLLNGHTIQPANTLRLHLVTMDNGKGSVSITQLEKVDLADARAVFFVPRSKAAPSDPAK